MIGISSVLDDAGYHGLMASDHLVYPTGPAVEVPVLAAP